MGLKDLYARARILRLAIADEYDISKKQEMEKRYREVIEKIDDIIKSAPF
jgi:hypothetical protein